MDEFALLADFHQDAERQGPGSAETTNLAITLAGLRDASALTIADIGCGTGASTLVLVQELNAHVTAVDFLDPFLEQLNQTAKQKGLEKQITTLTASMDALPFEEHSFDVIWSEGAIYNHGFEAGLKAWRRFLKPGGVLAVSELTWFTAARPAEIDDHWQAEYPEVDLASAKIAALERNGYGVVGYFPLDESCWLDNYYTPSQRRFEAFLKRHDNSAAAQAVIDGERNEIALYERFSSYFGYGFYIARKL